MLRARIGDLFIFGLEAENIKRLQEGKPIFFDLGALGVEGKVVIFTGQDRETMVKYLIDKLGLRIPAGMDKGNG